MIATYTCTVHIHVMYCVHINYMYLEPNIQAFWSFQCTLQYAKFLNAKNRFGSRPDYNSLVTAS